MSAQAQTSRRLFLAAGSASAVFGALAKAAAGPSPASPVFGLRAQAAYIPAPGDDPIFGAIKRHADAWWALYRHEDIIEKVMFNRPMTETERALADAVDVEEREALDTLLETTPTTALGIRAALEHFQKFDETGLGDNLTAFLEALLRSPALGDLEALS
jgi:hypothetical protein